MDAEVDAAEKTVSAARAAVAAAKSAVEAEASLQTALGHLAALEADRARLLGGEAVEIRGPIDPAAVRADGVGRMVIGHHKQNVREPRPPRARRPHAQRRQQKLPPPHAKISRIRRATIFSSPGSFIKKVNSIPFPPGPVNAAIRGSPSRSFFSTCAAVSVAEPDSAS